ncbi:antitoxin Xre-like helix-turn-helix domain-containing protein [Streptomyces sp. NPDC059785]|uniref:antitoxin Xre-like helix-turn-helix domain-containing protein n=1 Tax=Streptomyces sp. NPDC059785 TaxID=3346945 RepID=UPI0036563EAA
MSLASPPARGKKVWRSQAEHEPALESRRTDVEISRIVDPVLRDTLIAFEARLSAVGGPSLPLYSRTFWPLDAVMIALSQELQPSPLRSTGMGWLGTTRNRSRSVQVVLRAVAELQDLLGFTQQEVLQAAGVSKRTFQNWRKGSVEHLRSASIGRLWELYALVQDLTETKGISGLQHWLAEDKTRKKDLREGKFDTLMMQASAPDATKTSAPLFPIETTGVEEDLRLSVDPHETDDLEIDPDDVAEPPE